MKILVADNGLCLEAAITLSKAGHTVGYSTQWEADFPEHGTFIGKGFPGIERVDNFATALARSDMLVCFDTYSQSRCQLAKDVGKPCFGAKGAERLEQDRVHMKHLQEKLGLPTQKWKAITGINKLIEYLKVNKDCWVKASGRYRGLVETFHHEEWNTTRSMKLGQLLIDFGPQANYVEFLVEDPVGECEPGWDGFNIHGIYLSPFMIGYEAKDESYIGHVTDKMPAAFKDITEKLSTLFKHENTSSLVSFESRITKDKKSYLIDPCIRAPHPPLAVELEIFTNFAKLVTEGALGKATPIKHTYPYGAAIEIKSSWVDTHWCELSFPAKYRPLVKLQKACMVDGKYWALPGSFVIATCVGFGDTMEEAAKTAKKVAGEFKAEGLYYDAASLDELVNKKVPEGKTYGIDF